VEFDPRLLAPEQRIRDLCLENLCGNYRNNYLCPPRVGSLEEIEARLKRFQRGLLLQYSRPLDVRKDIDGLRQTKVDFHRKVLQVEEALSRSGAKAVWGMIGGNCALCEPCKATTEEPCPHPNEARTSLEAIGIDVMALLDRFGLDTRFRPDRITWTGCVLF
jgi:predicted metal-binding protein